MMNSTAEIDNNKGAGRASSAVKGFWLVVVWAALAAKSTALIFIIAKYEIPVSPVFIWGPSFVAAILLTLFVCKKEF